MRRGSRREEEEEERGGRQEEPCWAIRSKKRDGAARYLAPREPARDVGPSWRLEFGRRGEGHRYSRQCNFRGRAIERNQLAHQQSEPGPCQQTFAARGCIQDHGSPSGILAPHGSFDHSLLAIVLWMRCSS